MSHYEYQECPFTTFVPYLAMDVSVHVREKNFVVCEMWKSEICASLWPENSVVLLLRIVGIFLLEKQHGKKSLSVGNNGNSCCIVMQSNDECCLLTNGTLLTVRVFHVNR